MKRYVASQKWRLTGRTRDAVAEVEALELAIKDLSLRLATRRLDDIPHGVDCVITSCPLCLRNLSDASKDKKVIDIVELVALSME